MTRRTALCCLLAAATRPTHATAEATEDDVLSATFNLLDAGDVARIRCDAVKFELALPRMLAQRFNAYRANFGGHDRDRVLPINSRRFDLLGPVGPGCIHLEAFGPRARRGRDLSQKQACGLTRAPRPCHIISIGNNNDWAFEEDVIARTDCLVDVFDCTVSATAHPPGILGTRARLHRVCLGSALSSTERRGGADGKACKTCHGRARDVVFANWTHVVTLAGGNRPSYVKMDIEGFEWEVLDELLSHPTLAPEQVAVEVHYQTQMPQLPWHGRFKGPSEIVAFGAMIRRHGYLIAHRDDNTVCRWCSELLLVKAPGHAALSTSSCVLE